MTWALLFLACREPVIGMEIAASVTCEFEAGGDCPDPSLSAPCRCNPHRFDRERGEVGVYRERLGEAPVVIFAVEYPDNETCGLDGVVDELSGATTVHRLYPDDLGYGVLYTVDESAGLVVLDEAALVSAGPDEVAFEYGEDGRMFREVHTVVFRDPMEVDPFHGGPCCGTGLAPGWGAVIAGLAVAFRRRVGGAGGRAKEGARRRRGLCAEVYMGARRHRDQGGA